MLIATPTEFSPTLDRLSPQALHGVLNVNKPDGWTSHDVVKRVRSVLGLQKVGHAGTLDPHATGVLPLLLGKGTKIADYLFSWEKEYVATVRFGQRTDTQDAWGSVIQETSTDSLTEEQVRGAFSAFRGEIQQVPPMFSAVKVGGQPLYKRARKGQTVDRSPKTVTIHQLDIQHLALPEVTFRVRCSKGTYVRTLCEDVGEKLGVGGHLIQLQRNRVGPLKVGDAVNVDILQKNLEFSRLNGAFWGVDEILHRLPVAKVHGDDVRKVLHGNALPWGHFAMEGLEDSKGNVEETPVRVKNDEGKLLALGAITCNPIAKTSPMLSINTVLGS